MTDTLRVILEMGKKRRVVAGYDVEYVALTQLQVDAFVTLDAELARSVEGSSRPRRSTRCAWRRSPAVDPWAPWTDLRPGGRAGGGAQSP